MTDQAQILRERMQQRRSAACASDSNSPLEGPFCMALTSGKGGVGKTTLALNLAIALAQDNLRVCLWDVAGDANLDLLCGLDSPQSFERVSNGTHTFEDVVQRGPNNVSLLTGAGLSPLVKNLKQTSLVKNLKQNPTFADQLNRFQSQFDVVLLDLPATTGEETRDLLSACELVVAVTTPDPVSIAATYSFIKASGALSNRWSLLVNQAETDTSAFDVTDRLKQTSRLFLRRTLESAGHLLHDANILRSQFERKPLLSVSTDGPSSTRLIQIAARLSAGIRAAKIESTFAERILAKHD